MSLTGLIKAQQHAGTEKLQALVDGKSVAVVGNASSLFGKNQGVEIDSHDVVIRLNRGFIVDRTQQGSRTDIIGTARPLSVEQIQQFSPQLVYWLFWRRWRIPTWNNAIWGMTEVVPLNAWREANAQLDGRPTSGFVICNTLLKQSHPRTVDIFGFDFYKSDNFYRAKAHSKVHNKDAEEVAFLKLARRHEMLSIL